MARPPIERVTLAELRAIFNVHVLPRIGDDLLEVVESSGRPNPKMGQPPGTLSQRVSYWETTGTSLRKVATVHRYLRPDGTLGASGKPDPKRVLHEGKVYAPR
jgi:hypothetical protein